jgi:2-keto-4-pentenoate hydratase
MQDPRIAAELLSASWSEGRHIDALPAPARPMQRADGYAVQAFWQARGHQVAGWKIAATSLAGQQHIAVSGPLAGPIFAHRVQVAGASVSLASNRMRVAECEIVFHFGRALPPKPQPYTRNEVLAAVEGVGPGIEVPDSRFLQFEQAGEAQLIADCACANDMVLGAELLADERVNALLDLRVHALVSDGRRLEGVGRNVLGDPVEALVWLVNELSAHGQAVEAGHFVTTGACVAPIPVVPGQRVDADFGWLGRLSASFA